ncbi:glycosyltransferase family 2 protein [Dryocola sp. BD586]|uniref:glycosyltransferase family 2 protein n=1 Tax=Dryocola sp. BD586 TaxID=3133271 RepID=UPI003F4FF17C
MNDLVSIIMPTFNSAATIKESIQSVLEQTYPHWELLITDDCSTDDTLKIIQRFAASDSRIKFFQNKINSGAGVSRNNCIANALGRFIAFLDSDDMWQKDKLTRQVSFMLENKYYLTYTQYQKIDQYGNITGKIHPPQRVNYSELLKANVIGCLTAMYDTNRLGKVYMPTIRKRQDMALWLKILEEIDYAWCLQEELAFYREGHQSLSSNKIKILFSQWVFYKEYLKFNTIKAAWYFGFYIIRSIKKHGIKKSN